MMRRIVEVLKNILLAFLILIFVVLLKGHFLSTVRGEDDIYLEMKGIRIPNNHPKHESSSIIISNDNLNREEHFENLEFNTLESQVISEFGLHEYECTGYCSCEQFDRRSVSSSSKIISNGFIYLLAAVSTSVAINQANEYFSSECRDRLSESCDQSSIQSSVETCDQLSEVTVTENSNDDNVNKNFRKYWCKGRCLVKTRLKQSVTRSMAEKFGCEKLKLGKEIIVDEDKILEQWSYFDEDATKTRVKAMHIFWSKYLVPFCKKMSKKKYEYIRQSNGGKLWRSVYLCIAKGMNQNHNTKCLQIEPKPGRWGNVKYWKEGDVPVDHENNLPKKKGTF